jgi:hypothetical protein
VDRHLSALTPRPTIECEVVAGQDVSNLHPTRTVEVDRSPDLLSAELRRPAQHPDASGVVGGHANDRSAIDRRDIGRATERVVRRTIGSETCGGDRTVRRGGTG